MNKRPGLLLLLALLLLPAGIRYGRVALFCKESPPAFSVAEAGIVWVELGDGFPEPGVHQFIDGTTVCGVIKVAVAENGPACHPSEFMSDPVKSGERLDLRMEATENIEVIRGWMKASQRMVLGIPLQLETMTADDWLALPGIGPKLAARIEADRQKNGEFSSFRELERVPGVGPKRLEAWERYFFANSNGGNPFK